MISGLQNITIGRYFSCDSIIHRMDTRLKSFIVISLMIAAGVVSSNYLFYLIGIFSFAIGILSRIPFTILIRGLKPFLFLFLFTFLFHLFLTPGRSVSLFFLGTIGITYEGFQQGIIISFRLIILLYLSSLLTLTTSPQKMVNAIEWYLRPLKLFGFPVRDFSMMILISLKFIPILFKEINRVDFFPKKKYSKKEIWNLHLRITETVSLISPIVINSFHRANKLAKEIDTYGFDVIEKL